MPGETCGCQRDSAAGVSDEGGRGRGQVFLDQTVTLKMELDKCDLRFLPARPQNFPSPRDHEVWCRIPHSRVRQAFSQTATATATETERSVILNLRC